MTRETAETPPARATWRRRALLALLVLASLAVVLRAARKERGVLLNNQAFGARFLAGEDPYYDAERGTRVHGPYPPSFVLVAAPLSLLPARPARVLWASVQVAALIGIYHLLRRRARGVLPDLRADPLALYALSLLLVSRFLLRDTAAGGGNLLYMGLALAGLELTWRGRPWAAGSALGLGLALKPNLAPLLLYFAVRGRWRTIASALLFGVLFFALPAVHAGPRDYGRWASDWAQSVVEYASLDDLHADAQVPDGMPVPRSAMNQSLREAVHRLLRPPGDSNAPDVSLATVEPRVAAWIARVLALGLLAALLAVAWRAREGAPDWLAALAFLPLCLLLSPITWKAHHAALLPLVFALVCVASLRESRPRWLVPALAAYYVACNLTSTEIVGEQANDVLQAVSLVTWTDVFLIAIAARLAMRGAGGEPKPLPAERASFNLPGRRTPDGEVEGRTS